MAYTKEYISEEGKKGIREFKYKGGSVSIAYEYFWSPFCDWIVKTFVPSWVAPNSITFAAFIFVIIAHSILMYHSPDFQQEIPSWVSFLMFVAILSYQILDNCDGKQARATGSSSPLGMLFDHGCDSIVTWLIGMCVANIFQLQDQRLLYWSVLILCQVPFYSAQWSQYHVGVFKLGRINAIDEGLIAVWSIFLGAAIFGQSIFKHEVFAGLQIGSVVILVVSGLGLFQLLQFIVDTYQECKKQNKSFIATLAHLECVVLLFITHFIMYKFTDIHQNPKLIALYFYGLSISWSKVISHIQIAHITKEKFVQWRVSFITACLAYIIMALFGLQEYQGLIVVAVLIGSFICYMHLVYKVTNTMADVLGIYIFSLKKKVKST